MKRLVKEAIKGNEDAFVQLIQENTQGMYKVARSILKNEEDIAYAMTPIEYELEDGTRKKIEIDFCESNTIYEETGETGFEISTKRIMDIDHIVAVYFAGKRVALE